MKMKYLILFEILILTKLNSGEECALVSTDDSSKLDLTDSLEAQEIGTFKKNSSIGEALPGRFKVYNITLKNITSTNGYCDPAYFQMIFDEKEQELSFNLTEAFSTFDDDVIDQNKVEGCDFYLNFKADSDCKLTNSQIDLKYNIEDVNTHEPVFNQSTYILDITFPIASGTSLTKLSDDVQEISAVDKDFSTRVLDFEIMDENAKRLFDVRPLKGSKHVFPVDIVAKQLLDLQESITFTLKATDDGKDPGPQSGTTEITISLNPASVPQRPQFEDNFSQGKVDIRSTDVDYVINDKPIKLQATYTTSIFHCSGDGIIMNYVKCDQQSDEVNVKIIKVPDEDLWSQAQVFVLQISATVTNEVDQESMNVIPFILMLENVPSITSTTTTSETTTDGTTTDGSTTDGSTTDGSTTDGTTTDSTTTDSTITDGSTTESTTTDSTITDGTTTDGSTTDGTTTDGTTTDDTTTDGTPTDDTPTNPGSSSENPTENTPPDATTEDNDGSTCTEKDPDSDLITVIIILSIVACVLLATLAYGYFKYVRGRKTGEKAPLLDSNLNNISYDPPDNNSDKSDNQESDGKRNSVDSETYSKPLHALPDKDEIQIQNGIDREPKGLDRLIAEQEENNLLKPVEVKSRKRSMTFSESDDESRQYRENLCEPVKTEVINENKPDPVRKKSVVTFKL